MGKVDHGYGYGSGDGYGYGTAAEAYFSALTDTKEADFERESGAVVALWRSTRDGTPANGGSKTVASPGLIEEVAGPLELCKEGTLHATFRPDKWKGERLWVVALYGDVAVGEHKLGALKRKILCEIKAPFLEGKR